MGKLKLWNPTKTNEHKFFDRIVGEHLHAGGTGVHVHKYLGIQDIAESKDPTRPSTEGEMSEIFIQDLLFLENRDRKYSEDIFEMIGTYQLQDNDGFDLTQFGAFLANDTVFVNFHIETMMETIGRKLMPGDVLELPHLRDDMLLGSDEAINRYYVVQEGARPAEGFDPRWWPHLWRVKCGPITDSQEYRDILGTGEEEGDLRNLLSKYKDEIIINDALLEQAEKDVASGGIIRGGAHFYVDPNAPDKAYIEPSDGSPPNGLSLVGSGASFPTSGTSDGDFFLRTDFSPHRLFQKKGTRWVKFADDNNRTWATANRTLASFINNDAVTTNSDGEQVPEKTNLSQVVTPRTDT